MYISISIFGYVVALLFFVQAMSLTWSYMQRNEEIPYRDLPKFLPGLIGIAVGIKLPEIAVALHLL